MSISVAELRVAISASDAASSVIKGLGGNLGALDKQVSGMGAALGGAFKAAGVAAAAGGVAIAAGLGAGVKAAGDLQQSVANISTIAPDIDTAKVFASLNEMSTRVPQSASQLGDSLYDVFSSIGGLSQDAALSLTETFAKGATAAGTDAKTFGTAISGVLNAYKLDVSEAGNVSDEFFAIVRDGVVSGEELASSLGPVVAAAKSAGLSFNDLGPLIAAVTKEGGPAAQNINNLQNTISKFQTLPAQKALKDLGIATTDAEGRFRKMPDVLGDLKDALADMTEAERANAIQQVFPDQQARQGAQTLMSQLDFVNEALANQAGQVGLTEAAYKKMSGTFNSQSKILQNSVTAALTAIGGALLPTITPMVTAFSQAIPGALKAAQAAFDTLGAAIARPLQVAKDAFATVVQVFQGNWSPDPKQIDPFVNSVGLATTVLRDQIIPAVQEAAAWLGQNLPPAIEQARAAFDAIANTVGPIFNDMKAGIEALGAAIGAQLPAGTQEAAGSFNTLGTALNLVVGAVKALLAPVQLVASVFKTVSEAAAAFSAANAQLGASLATALQPAVEAVSGALATIGAAFQEGGLSAGLSALSDAMANGLNALADIAAQALAPVGEAIGAAFSDLGTQAQAGVQAIGDAFSALGSTVQGIISGAGAAIIGAWESVVDEPTRQLLGDLVTAVGDLFGAMGALIGVKMSEFGTLVNTGWTAVSTFTESALAALSGVVEAGWTAITSGVSTAMAAILDAVTPGWASVQTSTETSNSAIKGVVETAWNGLSGVVGPAMKAVEGVVTGAWNGIRSGVEGILSGLAASAGSFGSGMVSAFGKGITSGLSGVLETVRNMTGEIRKLLPGSDAEEGPLSDLTASGRGLPETLAKGVALGTTALTSAVGVMAGNTAKSLTQKLAEELGANDEYIGQAAAHVLQQVIDSGIDLREAIQNAGKARGVDFIDALAEELGANDQQVGEAVRSVLETAARSGADLNNLLTAAGADSANALITGIVTTLTRQAPAVATAASVVLGQAALGKPMAEGMVEGFVTSLSDGSSAMNEAVRAIVTTAIANGIPPAVALALAKVESKLNPKAANLNGESSIGLFQLNQAGGMGSGHSRAELEDPWKNAEIFLGSDRVKKLAQEMFAGVDKITPEMVSKFGGLAEVSAEAYWGRYGDAFKQLGDQAGPGLASIVNAPTQALAAAKTPFQQFQASLQPIIEAMSAGTAKAGSYQQQLIGLANSVGLTREPFNAMYQGTADSLAAFELLAQRLGEQVSPAFTDLLGQLKRGEIGSNAFTAKFLDLAAKVSASAPALTAALVAPANAQATAATTAAGTVEAQQTAAWDAVKVATSAATDAVTSFKIIEAGLDTRSILFQVSAWGKVTEATDDARKAVEKYIDALKDMPDGGGKGGGGGGSSVPSLAGGGEIVRTGIALVHRGEVVGTPGATSAATYNVSFEGANIYGFNDLQSQFETMLTKVDAKRGRERSRNLR